MVLVPPEGESPKDRSPHWTEEPCFIAGLDYSPCVFLGSQSVPTLTLVISVHECQVVYATISGGVSFSSCWIAVRVGNIAHPPVTVPAFYPTSENPPFCPSTCRGIRERSCEYSDKDHFVPLPKGAKIVIANNID